MESDLEYSARIAQWLASIDNDRIEAKSECSYTNCEKLSLVVVQNLFCYLRERSTRKVSPLNYFSDFHCSTVAVPQSSPWSSARTECIQWSKRHGTTVLLLIPPPFSEGTSKKYENLTEMLMSTSQDLEFGARSAPRKFWTFFAVLKGGNALKFKKMYFRRLQNLTEMLMSISRFWKSHRNINEHLQTFEKLSIFGP